MQLDLERSTMSDKGRGFYENPNGPRQVLAALGGPVRPRQEVNPAVREPYRGRCGNGARPPEYSRRGEKVIKTDPGSMGCSNEVAAGSNPLKLCETCRAKYRAAMASQTSHSGALYERIYAIIQEDEAQPIPAVCAHLTPNNTVCFRCATARQRRSQ